MLKSKHTLDYYLQQLEKLAFRRPKTLGPVVRNVHALLEIPKYQRDEEWLELMLGWLIVPYTLWPGDFQNFAEFMCKQLDKEKCLSPQVKRILRNFYELPSQQLIGVVMEDEHEVQIGDYDQFLTKIALRKYSAAEKELLANPEVHARIAEFFKENPEFGLGKIVMRRTLAMERNFRPPGWEFNPDDPKSLARLEFDSLCYLFQLFGVERLPDGGYKPLLQKLSINTTSSGVSIFIPRYWNLDARRDIKWGEVNKILRSWGIKRKGENWSDSRIINNENAKAVYFASREAKKLGLTGEKRYAHIRKAAKLSPHTSERVLQRLLKLGKELCEGKKAGSRK